MSDFIELRRIFSIIKGRRWLVIAVTLAGALVGLLISRSQTPIYEATTTLLVGQFMQAPTVNRSDIQTSVDVARTYADIGLRQPVLDSVVKALGLDETWQELKSQVRIKALEATQLIEVTAEARTPEMARAIADQIAAELITIGPDRVENTEVGDDDSFIRRQLDNLRTRIANAQTRLDEIDTTLSGPTTPEVTTQLNEERSALVQSITDWEKNYVSLSELERQGRTANNYLTIIEPAQATDSPVRPRTSVDVAVGGSVGLILVLALVFLFEYLRDTYRSADELYQAEELPVLGVVGTIDGTHPSDKIVALEKPFSPVTESYRMIRNKIQFRIGDQQPFRSIVVTSPTPGDGKSVTAANLAVIMAKAGHRTILVDADLSQPSLHEMFNVEKQEGLAEMLDPKAKQVDPFLKDTSLRTLRLVTSGTPIDESAERIGTERMGAIIKELEQRADIVIFDSPPALLAADAAILAGQVDGVVLVLRAGKTKRSDAHRAIVDLENVDANLLGCILNGADGYQAYKDYRTVKARAAG